jgi:hypothetical protein
MTTHADIEAQIREIQQRKKDEKQKEDESDVGLGASGFFDQDIYNGGGKFEGYVTSIAPNDEYDVSTRTIRYTDFGIGKLHVIPTYKIYRDIRV